MYISYDNFMMVLVLFSGIRSQRFALPVPNPLDIPDDSDRYPHDRPVCTSVIFVSAPCSAPGVPVRICRPGTMEGAMQNQTSPRVYPSNGNTETQFSGPKKLVYKCSNFHFRCFALAVKSARSR